MLLRLLMLVCVLLVAAGCRQEAATPTDNPNITIEFVITTEYARVGASEVYIMLHNTAGDPIDDAKINVRGDMSHAGMAPVIRDVEGGNFGQYTVPFEWTMAGDWFVDVTATLPDGTQDSQRFNVTVSAQ